LIEVLSLQALLHSAQGERESALAALEQAITLAEPGGFIRLFVDLGPSMARLLDQLRHQGVAADHIDQVLAVFAWQTKDQEPAQRRTFGPTPKGRKTETESSSLIEPLTPREMQVLALLGRLLTNKEIAKELGVSPGTVKTHTLNIYQKLDVHRRQQAVARAKELNIL
jgi:LuxR family maltose regulon positive regulatory protein